MRGSQRIVLVVILAVVLVAGLWIGRTSVVCKVCPPEEVDFSLLWEAWHELEEKYVASDALNTQTLIYGAVEGMVRAVGDPYTVFFDPEETKLFEEDVSGRFEGVGMEVGIRDGQLTIIAPLEGTPAQHAGFRAGDKIVRIEDTLTLDLSIEEAVLLIRGPRGTSVTLTIMRDGLETARDITVTRDTIEVPALKWEQLSDTTAYLKLFHFSETAREDFQEAALDILKTPAERIVLDLRNNPGGYLEIAEDIAGWLLERGQTVVIQEGGASEELRVSTAQGNEKLLSYPVIVLINQGTASAAEILAAALRDNRDVLLVGETSFGKGSVQAVEKLIGGSSLKVTIAHWLTPAGDGIEGVGLTPDVVVPLTEEDFEYDLDPQLDKALELLDGIE